MKNEDIILKWQSEARKGYYEEAYKRISKSILHNQILIRHLMTKQGTDAVGKDKALEEINKAEQFIDEQKKELAWLETIIREEHIIN